MPVVRGVECPRVVNPGDLQEGPFLHLGFHGRGHQNISGFQQVDLDCTVIRVLQIRASNGRFLVPFTLRGYVSFLRTLFLLGGVFLHAIVELMSGGSHCPAHWTEKSEPRKELAIYVKIKRILILLVRHSDNLVAILNV